MTTVDTQNTIFRGIDGDECEAFIAAVEELAFNEGWSEDGRRMLLFIRSRLRNRALRWFAELDGSVKTNLDLLVQAMFKQYSPVAKESTPHPSEVELSTPVWSATTFSPASSTVTLPANQRAVLDEDASALLSQTLPSLGLLEPQAPADRAATLIVPPIQKYDFSRSGIHVGRLRIDYEGGVVSGYIAAGNASTSKISSSFQPYHDYVRSVTFERQKALIVSFCSGPEPHTIACPDERQHPIYIGVALNNNYGDFHPIFATHSLEAAAEVTWSQGYPFTYHQIVSRSWNVLEDGAVQATLSDFPEPNQPDPATLGYSYGRHGRLNVAPVNWTTKTVYVDTGGVPIFFAKEYGVPPHIHPESKRPLSRARMFFEPLQ